MFTKEDIKYRVRIIQTSTAEDVMILDENYTRMIKETASDEERDQLKKLKLMIRTRITGN